MSDSYKVMLYTGKVSKVELFKINTVENYTRQFNLIYLKGILLIYLV